jgi:hypothetical protein
MCCNQSINVSQKLTSQLARAVLIIQRKRQQPVNAENKQLRVTRMRFFRSANNLPSVFSSFFVQEFRQRDE